MIICLAGFSGSGKSTLLQSLAQGADADWDFSDLDQLTLSALQREYGLRDEALGSAISVVGLENFRQSELKALDQVLGNYHQASRHLCLALGGGSLSRGLALIKRTSDAHVVGLDVAFETCWERISRDANRPLVALGADVMREKFTRRRALLLGADLILEEIDLKSPPTLQTLIQKLRGH